jgi:hypothetical protein
VSLLGEVLQRARAGRPRAGLGLDSAGQAELAEQNLGELFGAAGIERLAWISLSNATALRPNSFDSCASASRSIEIPRRSMRARTDTSGRSSVSYTLLTCSATRRGLSTRQSRSAASASSAAYSAAFSTSTQSNVSLDRPDPVISL